MYIKTTHYILQRRYIYLQIMLKMKFKSIVTCKYGPVLLFLIFTNHYLLTIQSALQVDSSSLFTIAVYSSRSVLKITTASTVLANLLYTAPKDLVMFLDFGVSCDPTTTLPPLWCLGFCSLFLISYLFLKEIGRWNGADIFMKLLLFSKNSVNNNYSLIYC